MDKNKLLFLLNKSDEDKVKIIINNILIMLSKRAYPDNEGNMLPLIDIDNHKLKDLGDQTFSIKTNNGESYAIKILFQKVPTLSKNPAVMEFINSHTNSKKLLVLKEYNKKMDESLAKYNGSVFGELFFLMNILDYYCQPIFILLHPKEIERLKDSEKGFNEYTCLKILKTDPISKYFNLKKGDIIKIIRPSPTAGYVPAYRIVY